MTTKKPKAQVPISQRSNLIEFMRDFPSCQVRDQVIARNNPIPSRFEGVKCKAFSLLRSKKHNHLAMLIDELGNKFVLTAKGKRIQLLKGEIEN